MTAPPNPDPTTMASKWPRGSLADGCAVTCPCRPSILGPSRANVQPLTACGAGRTVAGESQPPGRRETLWVDGAAPFGREHECDLRAAALPKPDGQEPDLQVEHRRALGQRRRHPVLARARTARARARLQVHPPARPRRP